MKYELQFLPAARRDMTEIVSYISHKLKNPTAAGKLAEDLIAAAESILDFPYSHPVKQTIRPLQRETRSILVGSYQMFYWIDEEKKLVTIARVIYAGRDIDRILK